MDTSSDDDCYVNSARQLKALRKNLVVTASPLSSQDSDDDSLGQGDFCSGSPSIDLSTNHTMTRRPTRKASRKTKISTVGYDLEEPKIITNETDRNTVPLETVCLSDSDSDEITITSTTNDKNPPDNNADENYEIIIKINWRSIKLERIPLRKFQQFSKVFEYFAAMENIPTNRIRLVFRNHRTVQPSDTPDSLGFSIVDILEGGIINSHTTVENHNEANAHLDENSISVKIQTKDQKKTLILSIRKNQTIRALILKCAEQLAIPENKLKLQFDGEPVHPNETAESLDLEGGECFDLYIMP